jgi:hypothetical protein
MNLQLVFVAILSLLIVADLEDVGAMARKGRGKGKKCCPKKGGRCPGRRVSIFD